VSVVGRKCATAGDLGISVRYAGVARHSDRQQMEFLVTIIVRMCRKLTTSRLLRKAQVRDRVDQLMAEAAKEFSVTKALLTWMLLEDRRVAWPAAGSVGTILS
jgi:hypothetical protein